jgi:hypothetical protein
MPLSFMPLSFRKGILKRRRAMPRYYFNIAYPGEFIRDRYGHELPNLPAAQDRAITLAQWMLRQGPHWRGAVLHIVSEGQEMAALPVSDSMRPSA